MDPDHLVYTSSDPDSEYTDYREFVCSFETDESRILPRRLWNPVPAQGSVDD